MEQICIEDKKKITLDGATRVISSTSTQAVVQMTDSNLVISGTEIEVIKLDLDNKKVIFSGKISGVKYIQKTEKVRLLKRIFK